MKVYIAAQRIPIAQLIEYTLNTHPELDVEVVSTWHQDKHLKEFGAPKTDSRRGEIAEACLKEVDKCDVLLLYEEDKVAGKGGKLVETGYALGKGKPVVIFGDPSNTLLYHPDTTYTRSLDTLIQILKA